MLDLSKLRKLSDRIFTKGGKLSLRSQLRMLRNLPKLAEGILGSFEKVDKALASLEKKSEHQQSQTQGSYAELLAKFQDLESTIESLKINLKSTPQDPTQAITALEYRMLANAALAEQKRDLQIALLSYELQNQLGKSGGALLRETCFTHWWYVLHAAQPHEIAFRYLEKIKDLPVTLLDIGANTGISALSVHKCAPNWPIFSIEGLSIMEPMLKLTKRYFDSVGASFDYKICGLGKEDGGRQSMQVAIVDGEYVDTMATFTPGQFEKPYIIDHLNSISPKGWGGQILSIETEVKKLDNINLDLKNPMVFIKMDVEGYELEVLPGMREFLQKNKPGILMESDAPELVAKLLETMGYMSHFFYYSETNGRLMETTGISTESQGNYFFFAKDSPMLVQN